MSLNYRRGYNWQQHEFISAPTAGWSPDVPAWELPESQAQQLDNFLIRGGKITVRGPFTRQASLSAYAPLNLCGVVLGDTGWTLIAQKNLSSTAYIDPWNAHSLRPSSGTPLAAGKTTGIWVDSTNTVSTVALTANSIPGPRWTVFNGQLYGIAYDSSSAAVSIIGGYFIKPVAVLTLSPSASVATAPTVQTTAPKGAVDITSYLSRLWLLGGIDPAGGAGAAGNSSMTLYFTRPVTKLTGASSDWTDPISNETNKIVLDLNHTDPGVAMAKCAAGLIVLRRSSVFILRGTTPASFIVRPISHEVGCVDARSVVETDSGVYWMSHRGLMWTDGARIKEMSGWLKDRLLRVLGIHNYSVRQGSGGYITSALMSTGHIMVTIGAADPIASTNPTGHIVPLFSGLFDPGTGAWVQITSALWGNDGLVLDASLGPSNALPGKIVASGGRAYAIGDQNLTQMEDMRSYRSLGRSPGLYDQSASGVLLPIPALWTTRLPRMGGGTRVMAQLKRVWLDHVLQGNFQGASPPANGWTVEVDDPSDGGSLSTATTTPAPLSLTSFSTTFDSLEPLTPAVTHFNDDIAAEVTDLMLRVSWQAPLTGTAQPAQVAAEIHGAGVEFQSTSDIR